MDQQEKLVQIIRKWKINPKPEYRGFRCAGCQKYIRKAWHHQLLLGGFKTPVHFCNSCQRKLDLKDGKYKTFTCGNCGLNHFKMYHIWTKKIDGAGAMEETHLCNVCFKVAPYSKVRPS